MLRREVGVLRREVGVRLACVWRDALRTVQASSSESLLRTCESSQHSKSTRLDFQAVDSQNDVPTHVHALEAFRHQHQLVVTLVQSCSFNSKQTVRFK